MSESFGRPVNSRSSSSARKPKSSEPVVVPENRAIEDSRDVVRAVIPELRQIGTACKHCLENDSSLLSVSGVVDVNGVGALSKSASTPPRRRKTQSMMTNGSITTGVINPDELYTIATFKHRLGIPSSHAASSEKSRLKGLLRP